MTYTNIGKHVFVVGSARSGTSLMASILQNSEMIASYRAETLLLHGCRSRYGDLRHARARKRFLGDWLRSRQYRRSGLSEEEAKTIVNKGRSYIGVLGAYMDRVASYQGCKRWVDSTPSNSFSLYKIATSFPEAKVVHMIRDGRAVALSLAKLGWSGARTSSFDSALLNATIKWQDSVEAVHACRDMLANRYMEIHYEELVEDPDSVLRRVCTFLEIPELDVHLLDKDHASSTEGKNSTLHTPNSPFADVSPGISTSAAYRWKSVLTKKQIQIIQAAAGETLKDLGYQLQDDANPNVTMRIKIHWRKLGLVTKRALRQNTPLGRFAVTPLEVDMD